MSRNFPDFLTAYVNYARDNFCPDEFHLWTGLSIIAGALERKVSLNQGKIHHAPNIFVMLVSHPAVGKTTAMDRGVELLDELRSKHNRPIRFISNQSTEPAMIEALRHKEFFPVAEGRVQVPHSSGYFYASEASSSALQNTCGNFVATLTALFDCPKRFMNSTLSRGNFEIENACMNLLAGSTFNYLKELVNEKSVLGGFASRLIYVVNKDRKVRELKWGQEITPDKAMKEKLVEDLLQINKMTGFMRPTAGFIARYEKWHPQFDKELIDLKSERLEAMSSRKGTNLLKLAILLSASESNSMEVTEDHFDRALDLITNAYKDNSYVLAQALISNAADSQAGLNLYIMSELRKKGGKIDMKGLKRLAMISGTDASKVEHTINMMLSSGTLGYSGDTVELLIDPDSQL